MQRSGPNVEPISGAPGIPGAAAEAEDGRGRSGFGIEEQLEALKNSTIMLVDDEPTTIDILEVCLQDAGYSNFVTTTDPRQALDLISEHRPDVVLLDLNMPGVGGFDILTAIRGNPALKYTPVVILTSATDPRTKLEALERGATDFLGKPADPSELALRLRNTLAAKAYQDRLTYYDGLTGLPNRQLLMERARRYLDGAAVGAADCAVLHVDLDRFKQINDTLGREVGDELLTIAASRLEESTRPGDLLGGEANQDGGVLARVAGDEFTLFLPWAGSAEIAARVARRVLAALERPISVGGRELFVSCSIGVALSPGDGEDVESLLSNADIAMSHAKQSGRNTYQFYSQSLNAESVERVGLEHQLRGALERKEILLHYQPKLDVRTGRIVGAEALMRWQTDKGPIPPVRFIPVAEESGLIESLGTWALETACQATRALQDSEHRPLRIAVNVSSRQFQRGDLHEVVRDALVDSNLHPNHLVLELTESMLMEDPQKTAEMLHEIKHMGIKLSIDDFGTGYSSLAYLKRFPLDELKIDRSFVKGVPDDAEDNAIVSAIIAMAHSLGFTVVAEGVETVEQLAFLAGRGCDEYQGFLTSGPVPLYKWRAILQEEARNPQSPVDPEF